MRTSIEQAADRVVRQYLSDRKSADMLMDVLVKMNAGYYPDDEIDPIVQKWDALNYYDFVDALCFTNIRVLICTGKIVKSVVHMKCTPNPNNCRDENDKAIKNAHPLFTGTFHGDPHENDGHFEWSESIDATQFIHNHSTGQLDRFPVKVRAGSVRLEVGTTSAVKTLEHIRFHGGVARWPYRSETMTIFARHGA